MEESVSPRLIELPESKGKGGSLSYIEEGENLLFKVRRIYWIYGIEHEVGRGNHCHEFSHRLIVCLQGTTKIEVENLYNERFTYDLSQANHALHIPSKHWMKLTLSPDAIVIAASSHLYEDDKTITDYDDFLDLAQI